MSPREKGKIDQKQERDVLKCVIKDDFKKCKEVIDLSGEGRLFQSEGALYLNARRPISLLILGITRNRLCMCRRL